MLYMLATKQHHYSYSKLRALHIFFLKAAFRVIIVRCRVFLLQIFIIAELRLLATFVKSLNAFLAVCILLKRNDLSYSITIIFSCINTI